VLLKAMSCLYSQDKAHRSRQINPNKRGVCSHFSAAWPRALDQKLFGQEEVAARPAAA